LNWFFYK